MLNSFERRIQDAYDRLGHVWGWRFLASPARTLSPETRLAFVGLNPGGAKWEPPQLTVEDGNAYRVERWGPGGRLNPLQVQMRRMYEAIAARARTVESAVGLMDETLAGNFCPFRSPDWHRLANRERSVAFSRSLWTDVFAIADPRVVICFGAVNDYVGDILRHGGASSSGRPEVRSVGWGTVTYSLSRFSSPSGETLLVRLPHLSRFGIFGRPQSRDAVDHLSAAIVTAADL